MKTNRKGGFTLIELLVVIAIIGILSSIVLVSLNSARKKGSDTRVISDVNETRTQLESDFTGSVYPDLYSTSATGGYLTFTISGISTTGGAGTTTTANANLATLWGDAASQGGTMRVYVGTNGSGGSGTSANVLNYAVYGQLVSNPGQYFCIDSTGKTNPVETVISTSTCQ